MDNQKEAWQTLLEVVFKGRKDVPVELISNFRKLATLHKIDYYCDFLRDKKLPDSLLLDPWEWEYLENLSRILPENIQIVVLKGAASRAFELYSLPLLRKSDDLDIFVFSVKDYESQKKFIECLISKRVIQPIDEWELRLKRLKNVVSIYKDNYIDIHFELFLPLGNLSKFGFGTKKQFEILEKQIIEKAIPFRGLRNIKTMNYEDFWLYCIFQILKDFPCSKLSSILDISLSLKSSKTTLQKIKDRAEETNQFFLYKMSLFILSELGIYAEQKTEKTLGLNWFYRKAFKSTRIIVPSEYSIKNRLINSFSKGVLLRRDNLFLSFVFASYCLVVNNLVFSSVEEKLLSPVFISNLITKILYSFNKFRNLLKSACLKIARGATDYSLYEPKIVKSEKKLISLVLCDLKLTFNVPIIFYDDLKKVWDGFLIHEHLNKKIEIEKINEDEQGIFNSEVLYSNKNVYLTLSPNCYGNVNLDSSGTFYARTFWDVRIFALYLFRAMTFERDDLLLVHAGGVKIENETVIFPGGTSAGKTTLFYLLTKNGACGINDDTILLKQGGEGWFVFPTPFMSKEQKPILIKESKLSGILDPIKVDGGHKISSINLDYARAILLNNVISDFIIDDSGFILSKCANKIIDISKQLKFTGQIEYSLKEENILIELINKWLQNPNEVYSYGSNLIRLVELQGGSMEPTFKEGDMLCVEETFPERLKPKDVICFSCDSNDFPIVHRVKYLIKHKDSITVITKGDGCIYEDPPNVFKSTQTVLKVVSKLT